MKSLWWKILALSLLLYAAVRSLLIPLNPGIVDVSETQILTGIQEVEVIGYRTHFQDSGQQVMLMAREVTAIDTGKFWICGEVISSSQPDRMVARFDIPTILPDTVLDLYVNNPTDGNCYLPDALVVSGFTAGHPEEESCTIIVSTNDPVDQGFPFLTVLYETIRNLMWHVPMWFTMFLLMIISVVNAVRYLLSEKEVFDQRASASATVGLVFCTLGLITGSVWARFTWGAWWVSDPQLNGAMVTFMIYVAYVVLRNSIDDEAKRARISAVYNIFAFAMLVVLLMILPRFTESLHPGKSGNPAFSSYDLDDTLRWVFYPAVLGWMGLSLWLFNLQLRLNRVKETLENERH